MAWWKTFFDDTYLRLWSHLHPPEACEELADTLVERLRLSPGDSVLDAPCGYGRIAIPLAARGMRVRAVDFSAALLGHGEKRKSESELSGDIVFQQADLRHADIGSGYRAAFHLFSSLGYSGEEDDAKVLSNIAKALAPGGTLYLDTVHRDAIVHRRALGETTGVRGPDGITLKEHNTFDPIRGEIHSKWIWNSPTKSESRSSVIRIYSISELVALLKRAGFSDVQCTRPDGRELDETALSERLCILARTPKPSSHVDTPPSDLRIRQATIEDAEIIANLGAAIQELHWQALPERYKAPNAKSTHSWFEEVLAAANTIVFIAEDTSPEGDPIPIGHVVTKLVEGGDNVFKYASSHVEIDQFGVLSDHQRRGIGNALHKHAAEYWRGRGATEMRLSVIGFNESARRYYERMGFVESSRRMSLSL